MDKFLTLSAAHLFLVRIKGGRTEVLLQKRAGDIWASGWWDATAAGHVEENEPMTTALIREAKEEAGVSFKKEDIFFCNFQHCKKVFATDTDSKQPYYNGYFFVKKFEGEPRVEEPKKCSCLTWFDIKELPERLIPSRRQAIEDYLNGITYTELGWQ